jgi:hypothetical protein
MRRDGHAMEKGNLTPDELGIYEEIERRPANELLSYAWLRGRLESVPLAPGYPRNERLLNRALRKLQEFEMVTRVGSSDRSAWYLLTARWREIPSETQRELSWARFPARSVDGSYSVLAIGPECYPAEPRSRIFKPVPITGEPTSTSMSLGNLTFEVGPNESREFRLDPPISAGGYYTRYGAGVRFAHLTYSRDPGRLGAKRRKKGRR